MSVSHLIVSGTGYQSIPVTAGLAVGITFVVLLAFLFSHSTAANNSNNRYEQLDVVLKKSTGDSDSPGYRVSVAETGWVFFEGYDYLSHPGKYQYPINPEKIKDLISAIEKVDFFKLNDEYGEYSDGTPWTGITVTMNGETKTVINYNADEAHAIYEFEKKIDEILETERWVYAE